MKQQDRHRGNGKVCHPCKALRPRSPSVATSCFAGMLDVGPHHFWGMLARLKQVEILNQLAEGQH